MKFDPQKHHRASTRLQGYDYCLAGAYFITMVTYQRECLFGKIVDGDMVLNRRGEIVREEWFSSVNIRNDRELVPTPALPKYDMKTWNSHQYLSVVFGEGVR